MDCDGRLFLADEFVDTGNNYDDNNDDDDDDGDNDEEIERDLEDKLYAAVFHSNDVSSSMSKEIPAYSRVTSLTDGITLWKSNPDNSDNSAKTKKTVHTNLIEAANSGEKHDTSSGDSCKNVSDECVQPRTRYESISSEENSELCCRDESRVGALTVDHVNVKNSYPAVESPRAKPYTDIDHNELMANKHRKGISATDLYGTDETVSVFGNKNTTDKEKNLLQSKVAKKQKASPSKTAYRNEPGTKGSPAKLSTIIFSDTAANVSPEDEVESSDVKAEDVIEKTESAGTELQIDLTSTAEEDTDRPASIHPEDEIGNDAKMEHEASCSSSSRDCSSIVPSSSTSGKDKSRADKHFDETQNVGNDWSSVITLDDSEDSICEVPVPPKPQPPTINLDDSNTSTSYNSDSSSIKISRKKQKKCHERPVSKPSSSSQSAGITESIEPRKEVSIAHQETEKSGKSCSSDSCLSVSDDSMTESEEEHWGIIAGSQMNKDQPAQIFSGDTRISEIPEASAMAVQQENTSHPILAQRDGNSAIVSEEQETQNGNYLDELLSRYLDTSKKLGIDMSSSGNSATPEKESGRVRGSSSLRGQTLATPSDKKKNLENRQDLIRDDLLLINVAEHEMTQLLPNPVANRESETSVRTPESRKRPTMDSGKKSKHQNSPKKARNYDEPVESTSSSTKSPKENKENTKKHRHRAADNFFKPMNSEMIDYYNKPENFNIDDIRKKMPRDPRYWAISDEDLLNYRQRGARYWTRMKCRICRGSDHGTRECPTKRKPPCCHMCGISGHREPRCPNKMCLGCGKKQMIYMQICNECKRAWCNGCRSYGHFEDKCPDHWRRYHLTTSMRNVKTNLNSTDVMKPSHQLICCNCAKRGHDSATCQNYRWSRHFPTPSYVTNYSTGPAYANHVIFEDVSSDFNTENLSKPVQQPADTDVRVRNTDLQTSQKKRKQDKVPQENLMMDIVDKRIDESRKQSKDRTKSNVEKAHQSTEFVPINSKTTPEKEILLRLESELLNDNVTQASDFGKSVESLSRDQCKDMIKSDLCRQFLHNLITQFPVKLVVQRCGSIVSLIITGTDHLRCALKVIIKDWFMWPVDERSRFVNLTLPKTKKALMDLLSCKLNELEQDLGDPIEIFRNVNFLKDQLQNMQRQVPTGKTIISSKRTNVVSELANSQCKLNMILIGQSKTRESEKSCRYLREALRHIQQIDSQNHVNDPTYLQIVHHFNKIFAAYTPPNILDLLNQYKGKQRDDEPQVQNRKEKNKKKKSKIKSKKSEYRNYIMSLNRVNPNKDINSSTSAGSNVLFAASNQILPKGVNSSREGKCTTANRNVNCNIEAQLQASSTDVRRTNRNLVCNSPQPPPLLTHNWNSIEKNYYNLKHNFDNISTKKQGGGTRVQENAQHANTIDSDDRSLPDRIENNLPRKWKRIYQNDTLQGSLSSEVTANRFSDISKVSFQGNMSSERNRWQDSYALRKDSVQDNFVSDRQPETSENVLINHNNDFPNIEYDRRGRLDAHTTSNFAMYNNPLHTAINESSGFAAENEKHIVNKKDRKKKPSRDGKLPVYVQKRVARKVEKYVNSEHPCIAQKARELQHKIGQKSLTLHGTLDFEKLITRELEKSDHLLSKRYYRYSC